MSNQQRHRPHWSSSGMEDSEQGSFGCDDLVKKQEWQVSLPGKGRPYYTSFSYSIFFFFLITWQALGGAVTFPILPLEKPGKVLLPPRKMGSNQGLKGEMCSASQGFF